MQQSSPPSGGGHFIMNKTVKILLVEDDEICVEALQRTFRKQRIANPLIHARDGQEALELLRGEGPQAALKQPYLILLDRNMPRMNGFEFLDEMRQDKRLQHNVVFVLTTSNNPQDKLHVYEQHVAGYILKSKVGHDFLHLVDMLGLYWRYVELPTEEIGE